MSGTPGWPIDPGLAGRWRQVFSAGRRPAPSNRAERFPFRSALSSGVGLTQWPWPAPRRSGRASTAAGTRCARRTPARRRTGVPLAELHERAVVVGQRRPHEVGLVLPDRLVLGELLVDLVDERLADGRVSSRRRPWSAHEKLKRICSRLRVDRRRDARAAACRRCPLNHTMRQAGAVGVRVDAPVHHAAGRQELLARPHLRPVAVGLVGLDLGHRRRCRARSGSGRSRRRSRAISCHAASTT